MEERTKEHQKTSLSEPVSSSKTRLYDLSGLVPLTAEEWYDILQKMDMAAAGQGEAPDPSCYNLTTPLDKKGTIWTNTRLANNPLNRALLALRQWCGLDHEKYESASWRYFAFGKAMRNSKLAEWINGAVVNSSLVYAFAALQAPGQAVP